MKMKFLLIALLGIGSAVHAEEVSTRNQDIQCILGKTFLNPQMEPFLNMMALEASSGSEKTIDTQKAIQQFKELFSQEAAQEKLREVYSIFSDSEIQEIRKIHENPTYEKYIQSSKDTYPKLFAVITGMFKEIVEQYGTVKSAEKFSPSVSEITKDNFAAEVIQSPKPLIVDVYSTSCPPCRLMEPILEELSDEFKDSVRFVKINCDTEAELARKYGVTRLPTFLFIKQGQETPSMQMTGFTSKEVFKDKIAEFLVAEKE